MSQNLSTGPGPELEWTGERCVPWTTDVQVVYEHFHRYMFASNLVFGRRVLDLACGEGYGAAMLASQASHVVAVDIDPVSIAHATATYPGENLSFREMDMLDLSGLSNIQFDVVVCFEAIEHVADQDRLLDEIHHVLAPGGVVIISTPDREIYRHHQEAANPFHVRELDQNELHDLLAVRFAHVRLWGQNVAVGSVIVPIDPASDRGEFVALAPDGTGRSWVTDPKLTPTFLLAVASDEELPDVVAHSTMVDPELTLVRRAEGATDSVVAELQEAHREREAAEQTLDHVVAELQEAHREREAAEQTLRETAEARTAIEGELGQLRDRLKAQATAYDRTLTALSVAQGRLERARLRQSELTEALGGARQEGDRTARELAAFEASALLRAAAPLRRVIERNAPPGSRRRRLYGAAVGKAVQTFLPQSSRSEAAQVAAQSPPIRLRSVEDAEVTIVIPVHGQWALTAECLRSIARDVSSSTYRVIVVDDASKDETPDRLARVEGAEVIRLAKNRGFLQAANVGIAAAASRYIVLLNNDTIVTPGWLDALVETAESDPTVGIIGAKLVYPDGRLQEAGSIIFQDGTGWNYGRGASPDDPAYCFPREVDYCSAACVLVRREVFDALGGFDPRFEPAYYEDTDLAFSARELGYRVLVQPNSVVIHAEGASHGNDIAVGGKMNQARNIEVFRTKWAGRLKDQYPAHPASIRLASRRALSGRVLVMDHQTPTPDRDSGSRRMFEFICLLVDLGFAVTFVPHDWHADSTPYALRLREMGVEVEHGPGRLREIIQGLAPELRLVVLSRPAVAWPHLPLVRELAPQAKIVYDTVDLHFVRERRRAEIEGDPEVRRMAEHNHYLEVTLARAADATLVVSPVEKEILLDEEPTLQVRVLPNIHADHQPGRLFSHRQGLLFVGSFPHPPNRDGARWLVEEILPLVHRELPDVPLHIVGSHPTDEIMALARRHVRVLGWVRDLTYLYESSRLFVAPLRYGAGMKGKVGESLSHGLPVVTTRIGAEGMDLVDGRDVLIGDDAASFARAVVRAYQSRELWTSLAANGRQTIADRYSPPAVRPMLSALLDELGVMPHDALVE